MMCAYNFSKTQKSDDWPVDKKGENWSLSNSPRQEKNTYQTAECHYVEKDAFCRNPHHSAYYLHYKLSFPFKMYQGISYVDVGRDSTGDLGGNF